MTVLRSIVLFVIAAIAEIGGAWLIWQGVREHRGLAWIGAGCSRSGSTGSSRRCSVDANFGRILAAYGGIFVAGSLAWGMVVDGFRPDRFDVLGAVICLVGVAVIMWCQPSRWSLARRSSSSTSGGNPSAFRPAAADLELVPGRRPVHPAH